MIKRVITSAVVTVLLLLLCNIGRAMADTAQFSPTGAQQTFVVPADVHEIQVIATGAAGQNGGSGNPGGLGATVSAGLAVQPGEVLYVEVANGTFGGGGTGPAPTASGAGGAGGGASDLRTIAQGDPGSLASRLLVAGGGGGGSGQGGDVAGGNADQNGQSTYDNNGGSGGQAGTFSGGGAGGAGGAGGSNGAAGQFGSGGSGGNASSGGAGGGGGGGYYGGGVEVEATGQPARSLRPSVVVEAAAQVM